MGKKLVRQEVVYVSVREKKGDRVVKRLETKKSRREKNVWERRGRNEAKRDRRRACVGRGEEVE